MNNMELAKSVKDKAQKVYTPSSPIDDARFFQGRKRELDCIEESLTMPGKHIIIFGDRGVGKTSFLNIAMRNKNYLIYGCSSRDNFKTIFLEALKGIGAHRIESRSVETESAQGKVGLDIKVFKAEKGKERISETEYQVAATQELTPHFIASVFKDKEIVLAMDEFERIEDLDTRRFISEVIKKLSDANAKAKIIIVGIADSITTLIGEHESVARNIQQVALDRLSEEEIISIARSGEELLGLTFEDEVVEMIVDYSDRFPHFAHLLSLGCVDSVVRRIRIGEEPFDRVLSKDFMPHALNYSVSMTEETLRASYQKAIRSQRDSPIFKHILWACALDMRTEASIADIRHAVCRLQKRNVSKTELAYPLGTLIKQKRGNVLHKARRGCYKFANPMMKAYVRIALGKDNPFAEINGYIGKADIRLKTIKEALKLRGPEATPTP